MKYSPPRSALRALGALVAATALTATVLQGPPGGLSARAAQPVAVQAAAPSATPARTGPPSSIAVLGDSISQGTGSDDGGATLNVQDGGIGSPRLRNSWATGDWTGLNSYLQRTRALPGGAGTTGINLSANGANMANDFVQQAKSVPAGTGLVLIEMGGNDLCRPSVGEMTSTTTYRAELREGLQWLQTNRPDTLVTAYSVPDIYNLWYLRGAAHQGEYFGVWPFGSTAAGPRAARGSQDNGTFLARQFWDGLFGSAIPCKSLLVDPTNPRNAGPTPQASHASEARRLQVRTRALAFNDILQAECAAILRCRFDNDALFTLSANRPNGSLTHNTAQWRFVDRDISTQDHFHPSFAGQRKLADEAFRSGYDFTDRTAPAVTVATSTPANGSGWHRTDVSVTSSATDAAGIRGFEHRIHQPGGSVDPWTRSIGTSLPGVTVSKEGVSYVEVRALDANGNVSASKLQPVRIDRTVPQAHAVTPADGATFVQNQRVLADFSCTDAGGSDIDTCLGTVPNGAGIDTGTVGAKSFTVTATDAAGNTRTVTRSYTVVDVTPPSITIASPEADAVFDRNDTVRSDYTCTDEVGGSGLATCVGPVPSGQDVPTAAIGDHEFTVDASDNAGNVESRTHVYTVLDVTAPTITLTTPEDGATYAHNADVRALFTCVDDEGGSGVAPGFCEGTGDVGEPVDTSTLGAKTFSVTATDRSGNIAERTVTYDVVDVTAPTVSSPHSGIKYKLGQPVEAQFTCTDEDGGSGVALCDGPAILDTASEGVTSFDVTTTDQAGNRRTETIEYQVVYAYGEIREPINADGSSVFKAGSTVPVKFRITDFAGQPVTTAEARLGTVRRHDIEGIVPELEEEATTQGAANTGDLFRPSAGQYVYNLSTRGMAPGSYQLFIRLDDGEQYTAVFTLR